ncbi:hypothetical protein [Clostridium sporogenes]|uniref:hypothetical protein n=1 Tax=Clostridium sporogenes TaxID=1509 RepID=UPI0006B2617F|nr:hypothetical protein [Clostridium sporogenes]KOY66134.1 hypothetical protein AN649_09995 [Clostridium sporogenes]MDS1006437.1 hypothetical protein [Clostridium sporogenes]
MDDKTIGRLSYNKNIDSQANELNEIASNYAPITKKYNFIANNYAPITKKYNFLKDINERKSVYKEASEVIEKEEENLSKYVDFKNSKCKICNRSVDLLYYWYYLRNSRDKNESFSICCLECLKEYQELNPYEIDNYEIIQYSRCIAYYKCRELDNLRFKCQQSKNLTSKDELIPSLVNFCESSQAGVILSTYKMNEILKDFADQSNKQYIQSNEMLKASALQNKQQFEESSKMLKESGIESKRQFNVTTAMTVFAIILTIINIAIAVLTYKNNDSIVELKKLNKQMIEINKKINTPSTQKNIK